MPTVTTVTVKSSGGDYTSLNAAEAGEQADLVSADVQLDIECYAFDDTAAVTIVGWTTDATRYIRVFAATGEGHEGVWNTSKYRLRSSSGFGNVIGVSEDFVRLEGLQLYTNGSYSAVLRGTGVGSGGAIYVTDCIFKGDLGTASLGLVYPDGVGSTWHFRNCLIYGGSHEGVDGGASGGGTFNFDNCTVVANTTYGFVRTGGIFNLRNCYVGGNGTDDYNGTFTRTTCMHSSATSFAGSTGSIAYDTSNFTNVTSGSEDLHLPSGSDLIGQGVNLSEYFTTDIDGETRPAITQAMYPTSVDSSNNYSTLNVTDIDEDPLLNDGVYGTWDGNGNTTPCRVGFDTPSSAPAVGSDLQEFMVVIRKSSSSGQDCGWELGLNEGGTAIRTLASGTLTDALSPLIVVGRWNANELGTASGAAVALRINQTSGGTGSNNRGLELGAAKWLITEGLWDIGADQLVAAGNDQITGTSEITFGTGTVNLEGSGELSGACSLAFGESADLEGSGELVGSAASVFGESADLNGTGELVGSCDLEFGSLSPVVVSSSFGGGISGGSSSLNGQANSLDFPTGGGTPHRYLVFAIYTHVGDTSQSLASFTFNGVAGTILAQATSDTGAPFFSIALVMVRYQGKETDDSIETLYPLIFNYTGAVQSVNWDYVSLINIDPSVFDSDMDNTNVDPTGTLSAERFGLILGQAIFQASSPIGGIDWTGLTERLENPVSGAVNYEEGVAYDTYTEGQTDKAVSADGDFNGPAAGVFVSFSPSGIHLDGTGELAGLSDLSFTTTGDLTESGNDLISGSSDLTFGVGTADLNGLGELSGSSVSAFGVGTAALEGVGELSGVSSLAFTPTADIDGAGELTGQSDLQFVGTADLNGAGELSGSSTPAFTNTADLTATGELSGSSTPAFTLSGVLTNAVEGQISGQSDLTFGVGTADLGGLGELTGSTDSTFVAFADLNGTGELAGSSDPAFTVNGDLTSVGEGQISGSAALSFTNQADLNGTGELSGTSSLTFAETADLNAIGELSGSSDLQFTLAGELTVPATSMSGTVQLVFGETAELTGAARLAGLVALSMDSSAAITARAAISGTSALVFTGTLSTFKPYLNPYIELSHNSKTEIELSDQSVTAILLSAAPKTNINFNL